MPAGLAARISLIFKSKMMEREMALMESMAESRLIFDWLKICCVVSFACAFRERTLLAVHMKFTIFSGIMDTRMKKRINFVANLCVFKPTSPVDKLL